MLVHVTPKSGIARLHNAFSFLEFRSTGSIGYYPPILPDETPYFDWKHKGNECI